MIDKLRAELHRMGYRAADGLALPTSQIAKLADAVFGPSRLPELPRHEGSAP